MNASTKQKYEVFVKVAFKKISELYSKPIAGEGAGGSLNPNPKPNQSLTLAQILTFILTPTQNLTQL